MLDDGLNIENFLIKTVFSKEKLELTGKYGFRKMLLPSFNKHDLVVNIMKRSLTVLKEYAQTKKVTFSKHSIFPEDKQTKLKPEETFDTEKGNPLSQIPQK